MPKPLPKHWELIQETWNTYRTHWSEILKVSIWFLYLGLVYFALYLAIEITPFALYPGVLIAIGIMVTFSWVIIRLIESILRIEQGKPVDVSREAMRASWQLIIPLLWVGLLQMFVVLGAFIPLVGWLALSGVLLPTIGFIAFSIIMGLLCLPPLYASLRLGFSQIIALDQGKRGFQAIVGSHELVGSRWFPILTRQLFAGLIIGGGVALVTSILLFALGYLVGPDKFLLMNDPDLADPLLTGILKLIESIIQTLMTPLALIFLVKLYRGIKATQ